MEVVELEPVPKYVCEGKYLVIGKVAVYKFVDGKWKLAACCKDNKDAGEAGDALGIQNLFLQGSIMTICLYTAYLHNK